MTDRLLLLLLQISKVNVKIFVPSIQISTPNAGAKIKLNVEIEKKFFYANENDICSGHFGSITLQ